MSEMTEAESFERFEEGLKKAASRARELGILFASDKWAEIAASFDLMRRNGAKFYHGAAISRQEALRMIDAEISKMVPN